MKRALTALLIVSICGVSATLLSARSLQDLPNDRYSRREADDIGARLFRAIVGRDGGDQGPRQAADQILLGKLPAQVEAMFNSPEFRQKAAGMTPTQILDQIYQGLLDRKTDDAGIRTYLREIEQRQYAIVVLKIINDTEFETRILGRPTRNRGGGGSDRGSDRGGGRGGDFNDRPGFGGNEASLMRAAEGCQADVVAQVLADVGAPVLLRFEGMDRTSSRWGGDAIEGSATDVFDRNRVLTYRCEMDRIRFRSTRVTYRYDDRRGGNRRSDIGPDYPLASARACQSAVESQINRDRGRREIIFESAGVSEWDRGFERVYGHGRERSNFGMAFEYRCDVDRGRVTNADFQQIR
jgi:hypothetical protein